MRKLLISFIVIALSTVAGSSNAEEQYDKIKAVVKEQLSQEPTSINPSPIKNLFEVVVGPQVYYISQDGRYVFNGDLIDLHTKTNITDEKRDAARLTALNALGEDSMIIFGPKQVKHTITVFTDIDCGYCRKLHSEIADYNKLGIKVRYLAYPRAGIGSDSYNKAVTVWCADDRQKAMTEAKSGTNLPNKSCVNPVAKEYELGQALGVNGTPAIILENGKLFPGYAPAKQLSDILDKIQNEKLAKPVKG
ncbi:MAG: DsbC family protein [Gammaproteobacteria bacterium]|nr:DsbC family protein [Gammaproteobacteria bacterium]